MGNEVSSRRGNINLDSDSTRTILSIDIQVTQMIQLRETNSPFMRLCDVNNELRRSTICKLPSNDSNNNKLTFDVTRPSAQMILNSEETNSNKANQIIVSIIKLHQVLSPAGASISIHLTLTVCHQFVDSKAWLVHQTI